VVKRQPPAWASTAIWYSVYPLGACGAPIRDADGPGVQHRLPRLLPWLDHIVALGANGLALGPVWRSQTHGYDILDHDSIDPRLGDESDFDELVEACHRRGVRVLLDGVFNHVSSLHPDVQAARLDPGSPASRLFRHDPTRPDGLSRFEGHDGLVEYDHSHPAVADRVASTMLHWLGRGADGWRLDAAYRVPRPFWASVLARVQAEYPQCLTVAEVLHGNYAGFAWETGADSVTAYELWKALWSSLHDHNPHELVWAAHRYVAGLAEHPGSFLPWTFVGNHDVNRIASQVGRHDAVVATALLATLPGMPAIYYGDEFGWKAEKQERLGGDDAIRPALPVTPDLAISGAPDEPGRPAVREDAPADDLPAAEVVRQHQLLFGLRRRYPWLTWADVTVIRQNGKRLTWRLTPAEPGQPRGEAGAAGAPTGQPSGEPGQPSAESGKPRAQATALEVTLDATDRIRIQISDDAGVLFSF